MSQSLLLASPEIILALSALALLIWGAFAGRAGPAFTAASVAALAVAAAASVFGPHGRAFNGGLIADQGAAFAQVVIYLASAAAIPLGQRWFARRDIDRFEYPILVILAALGMGMMVAAGDLIALYV